MVTHIVMWNFDASLTEETKKQAAAEMKEKLEALKEIVPGVLSVKVITEPLVSAPETSPLSVNTRTKPP